jgi:zinc protease
LELLTSCLKEPAFSATEFEELRREELADLEEQKDDPNSIGGREVARITASFPKGHPFAVTTAVEDLELLKRVTVEQTRAFHARFYGAQAALISVVGDFEEASVKAVLSQRFGDWKAKETYTRIATPYRAIEPKVSVIQTPDKAMAFYAAVMPVQLRDTDPDYPALVMGNALLGGGFLTGRIPKRLREKDGLSYGASTSVRAQPFFDNGVFSGEAIYAPQNLEKIDRGFFEELNLALSGGFGADEFKEAQEGLLKKREVSRAEDARLAASLTSWLESDRTFAFEGEVDQKIKALTAAQVQSVLKKYINPKSLSVIQVGDFKKK